MIDCHCHLSDKEFDNDLPEVIERAEKAGVLAALVNTEHNGEYEKTLRLWQQHAPFVQPCIAVHPVQYDVEPNGNLVYRSAKMADLAGLDAFYEQHSSSIVAVGETGLDFTPRYIQSDGDKDEQRAVFAHQIRLALKHDLPVICHSRSCGRPTVDVLLREAAGRVLLHAFDGNNKSAAPAIAAGFHFSVPPSAIHSDQKKSLIKAVPIEQLLLETDSPVLGPSKTERNEPANITHSAKLIAEIKGMTIEDVIRVTTDNAYRLFPKLVARLKK